MTAIHKFACNCCDKTVEAKWNGEHYLPPEDWVKVVTAQECIVGHLCKVCWKIKTDDSTYDYKVKTQLTSTQTEW